MKRNRAVLQAKKPKSCWTKVKIGLEWSFLLLALLVVVMPFTGMNTFARGNDANRAFAGIINISTLNVGDSEEDQAALSKEVQQVAALVQPGMTDVQKVKTVHDYLVRNIKYDYTNYLNQTVPMVSYTAYGAMVKKTAVCEGYSLAFQQIMDELGIPCVVVGSDSMKHAWNMVQVDGEWYHIDTTWDDPAPDMGDYVSYDCFLLSDARISDEVREHQAWTVRLEDGSQEEAPKAVSKKYDYMNRRDWAG